MVEAVIEVDWWVLNHKILLTNAGMLDGQAGKGVGLWLSNQKFEGSESWCSARADTCLGWDAWRHPVICATQRPKVVFSILWFSTHHFASLTVSQACHLSPKYFASFFCTINLNPIANSGNIAFEFCFDLNKFYWHKHCILMVTFSNTTLHLDCFPHIW